MCPLCSFLDEQQQLLSDGVTRVKGRHTRVEEREKTTAPEAMIDPRGRWISGVPRKMLIQTRFQIRMLHKL